MASARVGASGRLMGWARVLLVALYATSIPLVANVQVDRTIRVVLYQYRSYGVTVGVAVCLVAFVLLRPGRIVRFLRSGQHIGLLLASLLFPLYYVVAGTLKDRVTIPVVGLYVLWSLATFLVFPLLFSTRLAVCDLALALILGNGLAWALGYYLYVTEPITMRFEERESFGYSNPNLYGQILQVIFAMALWLVAEQRASGRGRRWVRRTLVVVCWLCVVGAVDARSRNVVAFMFTTVVAYGIFSRKNAGLLWGLVVLLLGAGVGVAINEVSFVELDRLSSGRLGLWGRHVSELFNSTDEASALLFGAGREFNPGAGVTYSDLRTEATFRKYHVDNFYLELLVEGGLFGALLFLLPYGIVARRFWRSRVRQDRRVLANVVLAFIVGIAVQGNFAPTIPIFNSPLGFMVAVFLGSATLMRYDMPPNAQPSVPGLSGVGRRMSTRPVGSRRAGVA